MLMYESHNSEKVRHFDRGVQYNLDFPIPHFHEWYELLYVRDGEIDVYSGKIQRTMYTGQAALFLCNQVHSYQTPEYSVVNLSLFSPDYIDDFYKQTKNQTSLDFAFSCKEFPANYAVQTLFNTPEPDFYTVKSALYALCAAYVKNIKLVEKSKTDQDLLHRMLDFVSEHFQKPVTLQEFARQSGYDPHYLSRFFNQAVGMHFSRFVNEHRVHYAKNAIVQTDKTLTEIGVDSGFESIRNFNRVFKEFTGMTPKEYRNGQKGNM